jgi:hypothetical protein
MEACTHSLSALGACVLSSRLRCGRCFEWNRTMEISHVTGYVRFAGASRHAMKHVAWSAAMLFDQPKK